MILNVGQQNPYQQMKYITLCRSCFCYVSVNECGRVWPQYFNMFVLCVKDEKQWPWWHWTKLCYLRAISLFYWRRCHLWPQVWLGGLSVAVGKLWCHSFVLWAPTQQSKLSNPSSSVEDVKWHTLEMLFETGTILLPCFSWTNWFVEWEDILQNWLVDASQMVSCI